MPPHEMAPQKEHPLVINIDENTIYDGGADDDLYLHMFEDVQRYTDKNMAYGWNGIIYTDGQGKYWSI